MALPFVATAYVVSLLFLLFMWVALASSWNLLSGYTGYVSFGHAGFFGVGAYTAAILIWRLPWEWWLACLAGGALCAVLALVIGGPPCACAGPTSPSPCSGLSEVGRIVAVRLGAADARRPRDLPAAGARSSRPTTTPMLALAGAATALVYAVATSKIGLRLLAIREDETAAEVVGVPTTRYKLLVFTLSAFFPGVAGGLYAWHVSYIDPARCSPWHLGADHRLGDVRRRRHGVRPGGGRAWC